MSIIWRIKEAIVNYRVSKHERRKDFYKGMVLTWNWMGLHSLPSAEKKDRFVVEGYYEEGIKTTTGEMIGDFWLKRV